MVAERRGGVPGKTLWQSTNRTALAIILAIDIAIFLFDTTTGGVALADE
jgi:hypothetical protein